MLSRAIARALVARLSMEESDAMTRCTTLTVNGEAVETWPSRASC